MISHEYLLFIPQGANLIQAKLQAPSDKSGTDSPIKSFILLERYNAVKIVQSIHATLAALSKVIRGTQLLTSEVQSISVALMSQEVGHFVSPYHFHICKCIDIASLFV